jgi:cobalamin-dependent methionine synthase I
MLVIANNITTRNRRVSEALKLRAAESISHRVADRIIKERIDFLQGLARDCVKAGADILDINLQQRQDGPEMMKFAVETIQGAVDCQLCLSSNRADTLEAGLRTCRRPPIVNYVSLNEEKLKEILPLVARYKAEVILNISDPTALSSTEDTLKSSAVLAGAANEYGISNKHIFLDPGVLHVTSDVGQRHIKTLLELIPAFFEIFDPPIRTTSWINNVSAGAPRRLRPVINNIFLAMLAGVGLSSAFVDALNRETMRTMRLIRILRDDAIYTDRDAELC